MAAWLNSVVQILVEEAIDLIHEALTSPDTGLAAGKGRGIWEEGCE
jgi:hypothetical protein